MRLTEQVVLTCIAGMWMTCTNKGYDFAFARDVTGAKWAASSHHLCS